MSRAFSANDLAVPISLERCPRLEMKTAPLALNINPAGSGDGRLQVPNLSATRCLMHEDVRPPSRQGRFGERAKHGPPRQELNSCLA